jgi:hypothetical protein
MADQRTYEQVRDAFLEMPPVNRYDPFPTRDESHTSVFDIDDSFLGYSTVRSAVGRFNDS